MSGVFLGLVVCYLAVSLGLKISGAAAGRLGASEKAAFAAGLGLGFIAYGVLLLGLAGKLSTSSLLWMVIGLGILSLWGRRAVWSVFCDAARNAVSNDAEETNAAGPLPLLDRIILVLAAVTALAALAGVLAPETANDSLCYHLHLPKRFLIAQKIFAAPFEINALFPALMEMLYTLGLAIDGVSMAKFFHFAAGAGGALAVYALAGRCGGRRAGVWAAALYLTTPGIVNQMGTTYVDAGLAFYTALALAAVLSWVREPRYPYLALAGIFSGFALSVKYLAAISFLALVLIIAVTALKRKRGFKACVRGLAVFSGLAFVTGAYWYLRSWAHFGSPVYPYFYSIFKAGDPAMTYADIGVAKTVLGFLRAPWEATLHPERFDGFGVQFGPAYLAFLPLTAFVLGKNGQARVLGFFAFFYYACWFFLGQSLRFLFPALPALAALTGMGLAEAASRGGRAGRLTGFLFAAVLVLHTGLALYHYRNDFAVALGLESAESYLLRRERSFETARFVNRNISHASRILADDETHLFYFDPPVVRETIYSRWERYESKAGSVDDVPALLRRDGFTHILMTRGPNTADPAVLEPHRIRRLIDGGQNLLAPGLKLIYSTRFESEDAGATDYRLYELSSP